MIWMPCIHLIVNKFELIEGKDTNFLRFHFFVLKVKEEGQKRRQGED